MLGAPLAFSTFFARFARSESRKNYLKMPKNGYSLSVCSQVAAKHAKTPAQVLLRWALDQDVSAVCLGVGWVPHPLYR